MVGGWLRRVFLRELNHDHPWILEPQFACDAVSKHQFLAGTQGTRRISCSSRTSIKLQHSLEPSNLQLRCCPQNKSHLSLLLQKWNSLTFCWKISMFSTEGLADYQPEDPRGSGPRSRKLKPIGSIFLDFEKRSFGNLPTARSTQGFQGFQGVQAQPSRSARFSC